MNGNDVLHVEDTKEETVQLVAPQSQLVLHRLLAVRRAKGVTRRVLARRLGLTVQDVRQIEDSPDIAVSTLTQWASALDVPITELVVEPDQYLAVTRLPRAQAARLMKAATKLRDRSRRRSIQRLAQTFVDQIAEIVPALEELAQKAHRRSRRSDKASWAGALRPLPEHVFFVRREPCDR